MHHRFTLALTASTLLLAACGDDTAPSTDSTSPPATGATTSPATEPTTPTTEPTTQPAEPTAPPTEPTTPPPTTNGGLAEVADRLADAERRWAAAGMSTYSMDVRTICFCPETVTRVDVVDGVAVSARATGGTAADPVTEPVARTVEDLFDDLRKAIADDVARIDATFDESTGRPLSYWVDVDEGIADEEYGVEVTELEPTTTMAGADWFATDLPCGHGFATVAADEQLILDIRWTSDLAFADAPISIDADVPGRDWMGEIRIGADLAANWCDDVIEPDEPTPQADEWWTVTGGRLVAASDPSDPTVVSGSIIGLEVTTDDGTVLSLGDVELENQAWGVYAG